MTLRNALLALAVAWSAASAGAQSVHIAERPTVGPFATMQAAIDAALEGESLLVAPGNYAPFVIDGKSVRMFVTGTGSPAKVTGQVVVRNLGAGQSVLLSRLDLTGEATWTMPPALEISAVTGHVRIQDCVIRGADAVPGAIAAGVAARVTASLNVVFSGCSIQGRSMGFLSGEWPIDGGAGIEAVDSSLALYDCTVQGGKGSEETVPKGGNGGAGCSIVNYGLFAAGCTFTGGNGGGGDFTGCYDGGAGGDGLRLQSAQAHLLENTYAGGAGGWTLCGAFGIPGQGIGAHGNSTVDHLPGKKRKLVAPLVVADDVPAQVTVTGQSGDRVFLLTATRPSFLWKRTFNGVWMVPTPLFVSAVAQGTIGANGSLVIPRSFPVLSEPAKVQWLQAICVDTAGVPTLTGPAHVLSINAASGPDCDGNGRHDFVDVLIGGASDCDQDLRPDVCAPDCDLDGTPDPCELANGTATDCDNNGVPDDCDVAGGGPDCNANGILDACDIANHTSSDVNGNGIPDECEASNVTWHVDAAAPPGGNGSSGAPFQNISQGIAAAFHGDTLLLAPGIYVGAGNHDLNLGGRSLTLRSTAGSQSCTIDGQNWKRMLEMSQGEDVVIEGITFLDGHSWQYGGALYSIGGALVLRDCVFVSCDATRGGGAVYSQDGLLSVEDCQFLQNTCTSPAWAGGGAIEIVRTALGVQDCVFFDNHADTGGAIYVNQFANPKIRIAHSSFLANSAAFGGAITDLSTPPAGEVVRIDNCLMAGNVAIDDGGALMTLAGTVITSSSFVHNTAGDRGGALHLRRSPLFELHDSVVFMNSAPNGAQIFLGEPGIPGKLLVTYSDVAGGAAGVHVHGAVTLTWGAGNLDTDPLFTDPDGPDNQIGTVLDNDYTLGLVSPCIDAGDNGRLALDFLDVDGDGIKLETVPWDLRHLPRRVDQPGVPDTGAGTAPITDMGAYER